MDRLFSILFLFVFVMTVADAGRGYRSTNRIEAIYSFGDSIADTGNLIREGVDGAFAAIADLPYGQSTLFRKSSGRCSDGLLMIDYLASNYRLSYLRPYLNTAANFNEGVNFAVAGATALDPSFFAERGIMLPFTNSSLSVQLQWFKSHLNSTFSSKRDSAIKLKHSLVLMGEIGGNDYNYALLGMKSVGDVVSYVPHVVKSIINATKEVIASGAIRVVIPGNFPIGCMPSYLATFRTEDPTAYDAQKCLKGLNSIAMLHNQELTAGIKALRRRYPHVTIKYADYYRSFKYMLHKAVDFGFKNDTLLKACCGAGGEYNFVMNEICGAPGSTVCLNPARQISWDGIHLTQEAYRIMANLLMKKFTN